MLLKVVTIIIKSFTWSIQTLWHPPKYPCNTPLIPWYLQNCIVILWSDNSQIVVSVIILGLDSSITSTNAFPYICTAKVTIMLTLVEKVSYPSSAFSRVVMLTRKRFFSLLFVSFDRSSLRYDAPLLIQIHFFIFTQPNARASQQSL